MFSCKIIDKLRETSLALLLFPGFLHTKSTVKNWKKNIRNSVSSKLKALFITLLFLSIISFAFGQTKAERDSLTKVLETLYENDQHPRNELDSLQKQYGYHSVKVREQSHLIEKMDSINMPIVASILDKYGWLSERSTSKKANTALFYIVQHAGLNLQIKYSGILKEAVQKGNAKPSEYAYLFDRISMRQGKRQIYGSQISVSTNGGSYFYPIKDEPNVNKRRKNIGLPPLQEVALESGFVYHLPSKDASKNKLIITGFVIETDQTPINNVNIKFASKVVATTNVDGFYEAIIKKKLLKAQLTFTKEGYIISDPPLNDQGKEVYELSVILTKK